MGSGASSYPGSRQRTRREGNSSTVVRIENSRNNNPVLRNSNSLYNQSRPSNIINNNNNTSSMMSPQQTFTGPGAYCVEPSPSGAPARLFRVTVPHGVRAGQEFQVYTGQTLVRVRCPPNVRSGQNLQISVPAEPIMNRALGMAPLTTATAAASADSTDSSSLMNDDSNNNNEGEGEGEGEVEQIEQEDLMNSPGVTRLSSSSGSPTSDGTVSYMVTIPEGVSGGQQFRIMIQNQQLMITCPEGLRAGNQVRVVPPTPSSTSTSNSNSVSNNTSTIAQGTDLSRNEYGSNNTDADEQQRRARLQRENSRPITQMQMFEVRVPDNIRPLENFTILAGSQRALVQCPADAQPGQMLRFRLPVAVPNQNQNNKTTTTAKSKRDKQKEKQAMSVKLDYNTKDGWTRTIRVTDYKFVWVRQENTNPMDGFGKLWSASSSTSLQPNNNEPQFNVQKSAYVRSLQFQEGKDPRMRTGVVQFVRANEAAVDSHIESDENNNNKKKKNEDLVSFADIASAQTKSFRDKVVWFNDMCATRFKIDYFKGHVRINIRREFLLEDSLLAVMSLSRNDLRKVWRFEFLQEEGIDAGGLSREWFQLVTEQIFNPDMGLWLSNSGNQMLHQINPASDLTSGEDHLVYFRFLGRVMGKALLDQHLIPTHTVRHIYKHILGWPITFDDLELVDAQYYNSLKELTEYDKDVLDNLGFTFTYTHHNLGAYKEIELCPDGSKREVNSENLHEYLQLIFKYLLFGMVEKQLTELLLGFFDVIPEPLLTVFDYQELELLMCGLPEIDMEDWKENTEYTGTFQYSRRNNKVVQWFWDTIENDFDSSQKAKLLQFVTGTSGGE